MYSLDVREDRICRWNDPQVFPVITPQWPWEIEQAAALIAKLAPKRMIEIGTQNGGSLRYWLRAVPHDALIYCIDPAPNVPDLLAEERLCLIIGFSTEPAVLQAMKALATVEPFDAVFIDGDHGYEAARADFENYAPLVREGGVVMFHDIDTHRDDCGVPQLWREIQAAGYVTQEIMCLHADAYGGPGGGIGVVYL